MAIFKSILTNLQPWGSKGREGRAGNKKRRRKEGLSKNILASKLLWCWQKTNTCSRKNTSVCSLLCFRVLPLQCLGQAPHGCSSASPACPPAPELQPQLDSGLGEAENRIDHEHLPFRCSQNVPVQGPAEPIFFPRSGEMLERTPAFSCREERM